MTQGRVVPASITLSHPEQLARLRRDCPEAAEAAVIAGDPCFDRMLASVPHRRRYRSALHVANGRRLVVVSSTWGKNSLLGERPNLIPDLMGELPMDEYQVAMVLHPNVWHGHGRWQVAQWLARCQRAGLTLVPPREGWRAALIAADVVIGDHGSVTFYASALGRPVMLGAFPHGDLDPTSPVAAFGRTAPVIESGEGLQAQLEKTIATHDSDAYRHLHSSTTAVPGEAHRLVRAELYRLMRLTEPGHDPVVLRVPEHRTDPALVTAALVRGEWGRIRARIDRRPAAALARADGRFLVVDEQEPEQRQLGLADVIYCRPERLNQPAGDWLDETLSQHPGCLVAATVTSTGDWLIRTTQGAEVGCRTDRGDLASATVYAWLAAERSLADLPPSYIVETGATRHRLSFREVR